MRINGSFRYGTVANEGRRSERTYAIPKGQARIRTQISQAIGLDKNFVSQEER
jgi:hypothetical protein